VHSAKLTQQLCEELNAAILETAGDSVKLICSRSLPSNTEAFVLSGILLKTIETANALLRREEMDVILGLEVADYSMFEPCPELLDAIRTACQTGKFSNISSLGQSLSDINAYLLTRTQRYFGELDPPSLHRPLQKVRTSYLVVSIVSSHLI
jgi:hypothetical protein